jgi:hypothetical protein
MTTLNRQPIASSACLTHAGTIAAVLGRWAGLRLTSRGFMAA